MRHLKTIISMALCAVLLVGCGSSSSEAVSKVSGSGTDSVSTVSETPTPTESVTPEPTATAAPSVTATETPTPTPEVVVETATPEATEQPAVQEQQQAQTSDDDSLPLSGYIIGLDPGHQRQGNSSQEPVAPGSSETKAKVSSGTQGRYSGVPEYEVNMTVSLLLKELLVAQGATVVMTHETLDVDISNSERAQFFNDNNTDYALRIHCNGSDDSSVNGALMMVPDSNPYLSDCNLAGQLMIDAYCAATGFNNMGVLTVSNQTGFNWCERMVVLVEMGYMTNYDDDMKLTDSSFQYTIAQGLCNGILDYFAAKAG